VANAPITEDRPDVAHYPGGADLYRLRHSAAHVLATAVIELFPEVKVAGGPPVENGFYYDFAREEPFTPEDLERIEARMREIIAANQPFEYSETTRDEAQRRFEAAGEKYKLHFLSQIPDDPKVVVTSVNRGVPFVLSFKGALITKAIQTLAQRVEALAANEELELAVSHAREVVRLEPYRESGYRRLMRMLERKGERGEAARVYLECVRLLKDELGVPPSEETQAVYREVAG